MTIQLQKLSKQLSGELHSDLLTQSIYATDASNYQIKPSIVICPKNKQDVALSMQFAVENNIPIVGRGGGTSLVGQTIGEGIVLDFTNHMDSILEINPEEKWAWVEPGLIRDVLNEELKKYKLHFAPDPATTSRATIGGMIANNSSGTRSIRYGKTLDHVLELEVLLPDGTTLHCYPLTPGELETKLELKNREGEIYRKLFAIIQREREEIDKRFPKVMRRVGGYNLDEFVGENWNLADLIVGSECTLALIVKAKIKLEPLPVFQSLCIVHFHDFFDSISHVTEIVKFSPASVELLDYMLIQLSRENLDTKRYCNFIQGDPGGVLVVEFYGETLPDAQHKAEMLQQHLQKRTISYACTIITDKQKIEEVFTVRKKGLGLLLGVKGKRKPTAFIEDAAVPLEHLSSYIKEVFEVCRKHDTPVVAYAHASVGLLHVKPLLDLRDAADIERMKQISKETLQLVLKYKGSWSGEHGDGLARSPFNEEFFGKRLYQSFIEIKKVFDPTEIMNPGKIVNAPPPDTQLRYGPKYKDQHFKHLFQYRDEGSFEEAIHLCNGVGECRKLMGGTMCPSFRATKEEKDSTRGRANALRMALSGQLDSYNFDSPHVHDALDLCLSCKACKSECPSNVDMSKLKSEVLHHQRKKKGYSILDRMIQQQHRISSWVVGPQASLVNALLHTSLFRFVFEKISGLDRRRILPEYTKDRQFAKPVNNEIQDKEKSVVLFVDTYIKFHDTQIGVSAKKLLEHLGYTVILYTQSCCQRPALSKGLLDQAKKKGEETFQHLEKYLEKNIPILFCEPSCASALKDDIPDLLSDIRWKNYTGLLFMLEDFLCREIEAGTLNKEIPIKNSNYLFHGHCHQKALFTTDAVHTIFCKNKSVTFAEVPSGCCGMAGSFGYEKDHYALSEQIANTTLVPEIKKSTDNTLIAQGFSCRHQIAHFSDRKAIHWVEAVDL